MSLVLVTEQTRPQQHPTWTTLPLLIGEDVLPSGKCRSLPTQIPYMKRGMSSRWMGWFTNVKGGRTVVSYYVQIGIHWIKVGSYLNWMLFSTPRSKPISKKDIVDRMDTSLRRIQPPLVLGRWDESRREYIVCIMCLLEGITIFDSLNIHSSALYTFVLNRKRGPS